MRLSSLLADMRILFEMIATRTTVLRAQLVADAFRDPA
jgi:hypothetical protein